MDSKYIKDYRYNGARSLVMLHEQHLRSFMQTWNDAKRINISLPKTEDPDYQSLEALLRHVIRAARGYMTWMCEKLNLLDPEIMQVPELDSIESEVNEYLIHLFDKWRTPLSDIVEDNFHSPTFTSRWGVEYCVDAMLEHAVMYPIRHELQLKNLIANHK